MRIELEQPQNLCLQGLSEALHAAGVAGFTGVSAYEGKVAIELPERDGELLPDEQAIILAAVAAHTASWQPIRAQRDALLAEADWRIQRAEDQGADATHLRAYRQALRDVTVQPDARNVTWPIRPW
jgi:hypothetical protein